MKKLWVLLFLGLFACSTFVIGLEESFELGYFHTGLWNPSHRDKEWKVNHEDDAAGMEGLQALLGIGGWYDGVYGAWARKIPTIPGNTEMAQLRADITFVADGVISFWFATNMSNAANNNLEFKIDNVQKGKWGYPFHPWGWTGPPTVEFDVTNATHPYEHKMQWFYFNESTSGNQVIFLDYIVCTNSTVADAGAPQMVLMNQTVTLDGSGSNGVWYLWEQVDVPPDPAVSINIPQNQSTTFIAPSGLTIGAPLTLDFQITVDNDTTDTTTVEVGGWPEADAGADLQVDEGTGPHTLNGTGSNDPWASGLSYEWEQVTLLSTYDVGVDGLTVSNPTFTAPIITEDNVELVFRLSVTNGYGGTDSDYVSVKVYNTTCPMADAGPDQELVIDGVAGLITLDGSGSTTRGTAPYTYTWSPVSADAQTVTLSDVHAVSPTFDKPVTMGEYVYTFLLTLENSEAAPQSDTDTVTITVTTNCVADAGDDVSVMENMTFYLDGTGSYDPDGQDLTYNWTPISGGGWTLNGGSTAMPSVTLDSSFSPPPTVITITLQVWDPYGGTDTDTVDIKVYDDQSPHAVASAPDNPVDELSTGNRLDATGSYDPQLGGYNFLASIQWTQTGGTAVGWETVQTVAEPTYTAPDIPNNTTETLTFQLQVSDGTNTDTDTVDVKVYGTGNPIANAGNDFTAASGATITLNGSGSSDPDGDPITYSWVADPGNTPVDMTGFDATAVQPSFTPDLVLGRVVLKFTLTVTDTVGGGTDTDVVYVTIQPAGSTSEGAGCNAGSGNGAAVSFVMVIFLAMAAIFIRKIRTE